MKRIAIAGCLAAAMTLNPLAAVPARAEGQDAVIGSVLALAIIAALAKAQQAKDERDAAQRRSTVLNTGRPWVRGSSGIDRHDHDGHDDRKSGHWKHDDKRYGHGHGRNEAHGHAHGHDRGSYRPPATQPPARRHVPTHYALPGFCLDEVRTVSGDRSVLYENCLRRKGYQVAGLPNACRFEVRTRQGVQDAFSTLCLRSRGYVLGVN